VATLAVLLLAGGLFLWVLLPLFGTAEPIRQGPSGDAVRRSMERNLQEFRTDLHLDKLDREDFEDFERDLEVTPEKA